MKQKETLKNPGKKFKGIQYPLPIKAMLVSGVFIALPNALLAAPISNYTMAGIHLRDCITACFQPGGISLKQIIQQDEGPTGSAAVHVVHGQHGAESAASAGFSGNAYAPTLSAYSYPSDKYQFTTGAFGFQRYEFTEAGTVTFSGKLTYSQSGASLIDHGGRPEGLTTAALYSFQMLSNTFDLDDCTVTNPQFIVFGKNARLCSTASGRSFGALKIDMAGQYNFQQVNFIAPFSPVSNGELSTSLSMSGNAGDVFFFGAHLNALAHFEGGFADSRNTLRINVDNPSLLKASFAKDTFAPAPISAPEPAAITLLGAGLGLLSLVRRRKVRAHWN
jgi:hypothetical protein